MKSRNLFQGANDLLSATSTFILRFEGGGGRRGVGTTDPYRMLFTISEFRENLRMEGYTYFKT
jgi:hypothetical protein